MKRGCQKGQEYVLTTPVPSLYHFQLLSR